MSWPAWTGPSLGRCNRPSGNEYVRDVNRASWASSPQVHRRMKSNRGRDTRPELELRRAVHALGLRFYVNRRPLQGIRRTADLVFPKLRIAVFLDGCFWHGCPEHHTVSKTNAGYWAEKVRQNRERDADTDGRLSLAGWSVVRIWEHSSTHDAARRIAAVVRERKGSVNG